MKNGWVVSCPKCGTAIDEFSLADEWFCECGETGVLHYEDNLDWSDLNGDQSEPLGDGSCLVDDDE